jgi:hypothetical protein
MLKELIDTNGHILENIPVDMSIYGKFDPSGVHLNEPEPVPNFYIHERGIHFYDSDWFITKEEQELLNKYTEEMYFYCAKDIPNPKNLLEIAEAGVKNKYLGTSAMAELVEQLYNQTQVDVLVLMDDYNWCFRRSGHQSFRYSSIKRLNSSIPPEHMSLLRLFMRMDGHKLRRGFKLFGNSNRTIPKHYFSPEKINFNESHAYALKGMSSQMEAEQFLIQAKNSNAFWDSNELEDISLELLMESQGNFGEMMNLMTMPYIRSFDTRYIPRKRKKDAKRKLKKIYNRID